ncbi:T9SS type A sorting domain-containing protein [Microvirga sp. STR05]|uniref:T9SS type A sorting domain-containing protein n=1 Tax=Hymenobacter duratus TaxID=2771356 RepID=A0ABR8JGL4_9BACT|nr:T9SS type A sorting domain-containing protein [Hymenobacter duratus]MBD2713954.1 T9SS type A sorting domain-containing protein [Hymenobacter duratus]MBR7948856.1 T9SS type A sorting domain-containing protein [Microvirga sp. STR05]
MQTVYKKLLSLILLLAGFFPSVWACSGQFSILYPGSTIAQDYTNGNATGNATYCPDGTGNATFTLTEAGNTASGTLEIRSIATNSLIRTISTQPGQSYTFTLPVESAGATRFRFFHSISCSNNKLATIDVDLTPTLNLTAALQSGAPVTSTVCPGTSVTLTATGAPANTTYTFRDAAGVRIDANTTGTLTVVARNSTYYTVETNIPTCGSGNVTQRINIATPVSISSSDADNYITSGQSVTLTAQGSTSGQYVWTETANGITTTLGAAGNQIIVNPTTQTTYTAAAVNSALTCNSANTTLYIGTPNPLPVELISFTAEWQAEQPRILWATASERNNSHFVVERSLNGTTFTAINKQLGQGTTSARTYYSFTDTELGRSKAGVLYYRLVQHDASGETYTSPVKVLKGTGKEIRVEAYPNPFQQAIRVVVTAPTAGPATFEMLDGTGRLVFQKKLTLAGGTQEISLPEVARLPRGLYFLRVVQATSEQIIQLNHR